MSYWPAGYWSGAYWSGAYWSGASRPVSVLVSEVTCGGRVSSFSESDVQVVEHCFKYTWTVLYSGLAKQKQMLAKEQTQASDQHTLLTGCMHLKLHLTYPRSQFVNVRETNPDDIILSCDLVNICLLV